MLIPAPAPGKLLTAPLNIFAVGDEAVYIELFLVIMFTGKSELTILKENWEVSGFDEFPPGGQVPVKISLLNEKNNCAPEYSKLGATPGFVHKIYTSK